MDYEQAKNRAEEYLASIPSPGPEYRWKLGPGDEVESGWYFDYTFEHVGDLPESEWDGIGGAPGFVVPRNGEPVKVVSWDELGTIKGRRQ